MEVALANVRVSYAAFSTGYPSSHASSDGSFGIDYDLSGSTSSSSDSGYLRGSFILRVSTTSSTESTIHFEASLAEGCPVTDSTVGAVKDVAFTVTFTIYTSIPLVVMTEGGTVPITAGVRPMCFDIGFVFGSVFFVHAPPVRSLAFRVEL